MKTSISYILCLVIINIPISYGQTDYLDKSDLNSSLIDFSADNSTLFIYPVPVNNEALLKYTLKKDEILTINLYDNTGRIIQNFVNKEKREIRQHSETLYFNSSLSSGNYVLELSTVDKRVSIKITKQ